MFAMIQDGVSGCTSLTMTKKEKQMMKMNSKMPIIRILKTGCNECYYLMSRRQQTTSTLSLLLQLKSRLLAIVYFPILFPFALVNKYNQFLDDYSEFTNIHS